MDRRNFLRTGGMAVLGSLAMPSLAMPGSVRGALGGADSKSAVAAAANHFGVTEADLKKVMAVALEKGGNYADLYFEHTFNNSVSLMDGKVNNCGSNIDFGMGVRVLSGDQSGYAYVEGVTLEEMLRAARTAARIAYIDDRGFHDDKRPHARIHRGALRQDTQPPPQGIERLQSAGARRGIQAGYRRLPRESRPACHRGAGENRGVGHLLRPLHLRVPVSRQIA